MTFWHAKSVVISKFLIPDPPNKPDGANRSQPLGFREFAGEPGAVAFAAAVAHRFRRHEHAYDHG